jgi:hypothetical protein
MANWVFSNRRALLQILQFENQIHDESYAGSERPCMCIYNLQRNWSKISYWYYFQQGIWISISKILNNSCHQCIVAMSLYVICRLGKIDPTPGLYSQWKYWFHQAQMRESKIHQIRRQITSKSDENLRQHKLNGQRTMNNRDSSKWSASENSLIEWIGTILAWL